MTSVTREHAAGTVPCILVIPKDFHVMKDSERDPSVQDLFPAMNSACNPPQRVEGDLPCKRI